MSRREAQCLETHTCCVIMSSAAMTEAADHNRFLIIFTLSAESRGALLDLGGNSPNLPIPEWRGAPREEMQADKPTQKENRAQVMRHRTQLLTAAGTLWQGSWGSDDFISSSSGGGESTGIDIPD